MLLIFEMGPRYLHFSFTTKLVFEGHNQNQQNIHAGLLIEAERRIYASVN